MQDIMTRGKETQDKIKEDRKRTTTRESAWLDDKKNNHTMDMDNKWVYDMFTFIEKLDNWSKLYNTKIAQALNVKR